MPTFRRVEQYQYCHSHFNFSHTYILIPTSGLKVIPWVLFLRSFICISLVPKLWRKVMLVFVTKLKMLHKVQLENWGYNSIYCPFHIGIAQKSNKNNTLELKILPTVVLCTPRPNKYVEDVTNPNLGLLCPQVNNNYLPFIWLPHSNTLSIIASSGLNRIYAALEACTKLRKVPLVWGEQKHICTNYGKRVMYTCGGNQVSRNSPQVLDHAPFQEKLERHHWEALMWMMRHAELCFKMIWDHQVVSHICHTRMVTPFKMMSGSKYYGGIAYGCNVLLCCHTDADFIMSISQIFLKGMSRYKIDNEVVVIFCCSTLGVAVHLQPGDFLLFNWLIPHCILFWCKLDGNIMCVSMYLKLMAVGMNNNSLSLKSEQDVPAIRYQSYVSK